MKIEWVLMYHPDFALDACEKINTYIYLYRYAIAKRPISKQTKHNLSVIGCRFFSTSNPADPAGLNDQCPCCSLTCASILNSIAAFATSFLNCMAFFSHCLLDSVLSPGFGQTGGVLSIENSIDDVAWQCILPFLPDGVSTRLGLH